MTYGEKMAANPDTIGALQRLGLNQYEAKAYYALSMFGDHTAGRLSERADLPRPRVYDVLERLQDKGFVLIQKGRPVKYSAIPLSEAVQTLKKIKQSDLAGELTRIDELSGSLQSKLKASASANAPTADAVWTLHGREAIYSKIGSMISGAKNHVTVVSTPEGAISKWNAHSKELTKAKKRGVEIKFITPLSSDAAGEITKIASLHTKEMPTRMVLSDDQALVFLSDNKAKPEDEIGVWLKSPHLVETFKHAIGK
ncbi:Putative HTH-type transcriptional regulator TrmBL2 [Candidatus Norongarragalina meridionalis]|nr:Putative HTH-type transcriptional regulator TrmBL2 [Candidatus Norongarragalina meridionalis]